ncbi:MAG: hypothetical protein ACLPKZ_01125 [Acidimicrobiales bacterium]
MLSSQQLLASRLAHILEKGVLAEALNSAASNRNDLRKFFFMEMMLASAHNAKLRKEVGAQLRVVESVAEIVSDVSDEERTHLVFTIREVTMLMLGVSFLSTVSPSASSIDYAQFSEPFRRSLLECYLPSWPEISRQLRTYAPAS